jgi:hypothetical protein
MMINLIVYDLDGILIDSTKIVSNTLKQKIKLPVSNVIASA